MKITHLLFCFLVLMGTAFIGICCFEQIPGEQGMSHPAYPENTMMQTPEDSEPHPWLVFMTGAFGFLTALFAGVSLLLGLKPHHRSGPVGRWLVLATVVYATLLGLVVAIDWYTSADGMNSIFGFPISTAMMLFVLGPFPFVFVSLYAINFPNWIMSPEDEQDFHKLVAKRRQQQTD